VKRFPACAVALGIVFAAHVSSGAAPGSAGARQGSSGANSGSSGADGPGRPGTVTVLADGPVHAFSPEHALGAGVDGHEEGEVQRMLAPENVTQMRSAGLKPLTYRLRTELGVEAWHWNPRGSWSDAAHSQGYWTSDATSEAPIELSYGYRLPRRGSTHDEANDDGYSRMDDGDPETFWKSNPYLDAHFTGEENAAHPQWVVVDFGCPEKVNALRIQWGNPFATDFTVEYATDKKAVFFCQNPPGVWRAFPHGAVRGGVGGETQFRLADAPVSARWLRIRMTASAYSGEETADIRDRLGYAIRELGAGVIDAQGKFHDAVIHSADQKQTVTHVSSTDPWHRETDRDPRIEQPGFDLVFRSGLTNGLPMLTPAAIAFDTPENAAAEMAFLKGRGYPVSQMELGEEPDGQNMDPQDYGALFAQFGDAIHAVDPGVKLGGPSFVQIDGRPKSWDSLYGNGCWVGRLLDYLKARGRDVSFLSFEWYPFDNTRARTAPYLARAPTMLRNAVALLQRAMGERGARLPIYITEYGYSAFGGRPEVDVSGAILNAEIAAQFLTLGGDTAYLYGYEPNALIQENGGSWGNNMLFLQGADGGIQARISTYYAARLLTQEWAQSAGGEHQIYSARSDLVNARREALVTAYAVKRPDRRWAFLLINKDPKRSHRMRLNFCGAHGGGIACPLPGPFDLYQFSAKQYAWHEAGEEGYPTRSEPPSHETIDTLSGGVTLPPYSLTVLRSAPDDGRPSAMTAEALRDAHGATGAKSE